jgi:serine/threonine protein kinase
VSAGIPPIRAPESRSPQFLDFIDHCLQTDPSNRWTAEQLLNHPFIAFAADQKHIPPLIALAERLSKAEDFNEFRFLSYFKLTEMILEIGPAQITQRVSSISRVF